MRPTVVEVGTDWFFIFANISSLSLGEKLHASILSDFVIFLGQKSGFVVYVSLSLSFYKLSWEEMMILMMSGLWMFLITTLICHVSIHVQK